MTTLSDTQLIVLSIAARRADRGVVLPDRVVGAARTNVLRRLLAEDLIRALEHDQAGLYFSEIGEPSPQWQITDQGLAAIGIDAGELAQRLEPSAADADEIPAGATPRSGKLAVLLDLLLRPNGASLDELVHATGWQRHSVRGAIAGTVKRKLGHAVASEAKDGRRIYRIVPSAEAA